MARVAATVEELDVGEHDGERAFIRTASAEVRLQWHEEAGVWIGDPVQTIAFADLEPIDVISGTGWRYVSTPHSASAKGYSWSPTAIQNADEKFAAGLTLEEKIDATFWVWDSDGAYEIAVVYYHIDDGDDIAPGVVPDEASPDRDLGTSLPGVPTVRCYTSTEWVECPIDAPSKPNLAPHLYSHRTAAGGTDGGARIDRCAAYIRWVGNPA